MNEPEKKKSVKKALGITGSCIVFGIAVYGAIANPSEIPNILYPIIIFVAALFGIKTVGGVMAAKNQKQSPL